MWKRICAYIGIPFAFLGLLYAYSWYETQSARAEARKLLAEITAQRNAFESLGDIDFDPTHLTLTTLKEQLHQPEQILPGAHNTTRVGWVCAGKNCEISASFLVPPGQVLSPSAVPAALMMSEPWSAKRVQRIGIGGIYLGESIEEMKQSCQKRGYGVELERNQITWDKEWKVVYAGTEGKVDLLVFVNQSMIKGYSKNQRLALIDEH